MELSRLDLKRPISLDDTEKLLLAFTSTWFKQEKHKCEDGAIDSIDFSKQIKDMMNSNSYKEYQNVIDTFRKNTKNKSGINSIYLLI
jgi:hypothetical protein